MAFELIVAAKRDPGETPGAVRTSAPLESDVPMPVATIDISGEFCEQSASELARSITQALHNPADTIIVRFHDVACEDRQSLADFARWVEQLRTDGHDVRVVVGEPHVHALLNEGAISSGAVMPPEDADAAARRRVVEVHR